MQNNTIQPIVDIKVYKRSLSGGKVVENDSSSIKPPNKEDYFDRNSIFRRSSSRSRYDNSDNSTSTTTKDSRSSSRGRLDYDDYNNSRSRLSSDLSDKYKNYRSISDNSSSYESPSKFYDTLPPRVSCLSPTREYYNRPPLTSCTSPPPLPSDATLRRRSSNSNSQKRISRFLRPDFYDTPREESIYVSKDNKDRDSGSTKILREIRERSRERSMDRLQNIMDKCSLRRQSLTKAEEIPQQPPPRYEQMNGYVHSSVKEPEKISFAEKIINELHNISLLQRKSDFELDETENVKRDKSDGNLDEIKSQKVKKIKSRDSTLKKSENSVKKNKSINNIEMLSNLNNEIESINTKNIKESKLIRPKSYPTKIKKSSVPNNSIVSSNEEEDLKLVNNRPKSFPNSKLTPPKEIKKSSDSSTGLVTVIENLVVAKEKEKEKEKKIVTKKKVTNSDGSTSSEGIKVIKKKVVKKVSPKETPTKELPKLEEKEVKEKSPEKKPGKGFLYSIGQKFEKLRESSRNKDKEKEKEKEKESTLKKKKTPKTSTPIASTSSSDKSTVIEENPKKSKIDSMIRNLRERSIPRTTLTESHLIKRAVSIEDMPDTFNKCGVNKVLGLFKKLEKDDGHKITNTKSSTTLDSYTEYENNNSKERPKSSGFVSKLKRTGHPYTGAKSENILELNELNTKIPVKFDCADCNDATNDLVTKRHSSNDLKQSNEDKERIRNNRKCLVLDFTKIENQSKPIEKKLNNNNNNHNNNNNSSTLPQSQNNEINRNHLPTPSYDNLTNYSSDSRSPYDDCPSSSTFLSPTEEPELCFDNWSVCSDDNNFTSSRLSSRNSQVQSPTNDNNSESIVDRIRRKSFYSRFNEKKPKRVSSIVGPIASKDYYRETSITRQRPPEYTKSATTNLPDRTHEYYRPIQLTSSSSQSKLKYERDKIKDYRSSEYLKPSTTTTSSTNYLPPSRRHNYDLNHDYSNYNYNLPPTSRSSVYDPSISIYGTYNPKRRSSYLNGPSTSTTLDNYSTLGRTIKPYEQRSVSLLDSSLTNGGVYKRDQSRVPIDLGGVTR